MPLDDEVEALLDRIPVLRGLPRACVDLPGGLTNRNLRVTTPQGDYVVRLSQSDAGLLGIDRAAEHHNTLAAGAAGAGPPVISYQPQLRVMTIGFLSGTALENEDFSRPDVLHRAASAVRRLHAGAPFQGVFDMFSRRADYLSTVQERGFALPAGYLDHADAWERVRRALAVRPATLVPCNNDLLAANYIDDGDRVWIIDYEYSGMNDACFELGNTATECEFTPELTEAWVEAYFEDPTSVDLARVRLQALCSEYGWALWGFIQAATSPLDFDFHGWGLHRYEKAARTFTGDGFEALLAEAAGG